MTEENVSITEIIERREELKNKKLKRRQITDTLLKECLDRSSIEERFTLLYYYIMNDVYLLDS